MPVLQSTLDARSEAFQQNRADMQEALDVLDGLQAEAAEGEDHRFEALGGSAGVGVHIGLRKADAAEAHGGCESEDHGVGPDLAVEGAELEEFGVFVKDQVHRRAKSAVFGHDCIEQDKRFQIQVAGERISIPSRATINIEHERGETEEEIEFQLKWKLEP